MANPAVEFLSFRLAADLNKFVETCLRDEVHGRVSETLNFPEGNFIFVQRLHGHRYVVQPQDSADLFSRE